MMSGERPLYKRNWWNGKKIRIGSYGSGHNDPIDENPPPGLSKDQLTTQPPRTLAGVTSEQLERSVQKGGPSTSAAHIEEALEKKED